MYEKLNKHINYYISPYIVNKYLIIRNIIITIELYYNIICNIIKISILNYLIHFLIIIKLQLVKLVYKFIIYSNNII